MRMKWTSISRRNLLALASAGLVVAACSDNPATGRRQFVLVSDAELAALGEQAWRDALQRLPRADDASLQRRLTRIGQSVADASTARGAEWEFVVFDSPEVNAFVLPGGKVGFFRGLLAGTAPGMLISASASCAWPVKILSSRRASMACCTNLSYTPAKC